MDNETLNLSIRKFLKVVGVSSQREIEQAVAKALAAGAIASTEQLAATMTLEVPGAAAKDQVRRRHQSELTRRRQ
jgi:hypothetical protein